LLLITESAKAYFGVSDEITSLKSLGIDFNIEESGVSNYHQGLNQNNQVLLFKYTVQAENNQFAIHIEDSTVFKHLDDKLKGQAEEAFFLKKLINQTAIISITDKREVSFP